jgi:hypothetical protein
MNVTDSLEMTLTIDAVAKTQTMSNKYTLTFSGGNNIDDVWDSIKEAMGSGTDDMKITPNDQNHSIVMTSSRGPSELTLTDATLQAGFQINQNGTKFKMPADSDYEGSPELIFIKQ